MSAVSVGNRSAPALAPESEFVREAMINIAARAAKHGYCGLKAYHIRMIMFYLDLSDIVTEMHFIDAVEKVVAILPLPPP